MSNMELRFATALVGACVRAAAQAHVPRRTLAAVAASAIAAACRGSRVDAAPARHDDGQLEANFAADRASAAADVRKARAAGRQRRRQAKRARRLARGAEAAANEKMEVEGSPGEDVPAPPPASAQATANATEAPATSSMQAQTPTHDGTASTGSVLPSPPSEDANMGMPGPSFSVHDEVIVTSGELEGAVCRVTAVGTATVTILVNQSSFHGGESATVLPSELVPARRSWANVQPKKKGRHRKG
mmetsp:Transcript_75462/g.149205  ORF Transcript_75462/g.149205 Transcript_75462/m.149205 type:complete len:245 (+) Transcript_75462:62-796(+)